MVGGCRLHSHFRGGATPALSSAEGEIMSGSELLKEALGTQTILEFVGFGCLQIQLHTDASAAKSFMHRRGAGRMKHIDIRYMWMQDACDKGAYVPKKVPRAENPSDMLTKVPAAPDVEKFRMMIGMFPLYAALEPEKRICEIITGASSSKKAMAAIMLASMAVSSKGESVTENSLHVLVNTESHDNVQMMMMMILVHIILLLAGIPYLMTRRKKMVTVGTQTQQLTSKTRNIGTMTVSVQSTQQPPSQPSVGLQRVSVSRFGERFHRANCSTLMQSTGVRLLSRCAVCNP